MTTQQYHRDAAEEIFSLFKNASYFSTRNAEQRRQMLEGWAEIIARHAPAAAPASDREAESLRPWLHHHIGCKTLRAREAVGLFATNLRDGDEATCTCGLAAAIRARLEKVETYLQDLLAIIHRDGGHHTADVGIKQSVDDAHKVWAALQSRVTLLEAEISAVAAFLVGYGDVAEIAAKRLRAVLTPAAPKEEEHEH